jgi:hypothetical protein
LARRVDGTVGSGEARQSMIAHLTVSTIIAPTIGGVNRKIWLRKAKFEALGIRKSGFHALQ